MRNLVGYVFDNFPDLLENYYEHDVAVNCFAMNCFAGVPIDVEAVKDFSLSMRVFEYYFEEFFDKKYKRFGLTYSDLNRVEFIKEILREKFNFSIEKLLRANIEKHLVDPKVSDEVKDFLRFRIIKSDNSEKRMKKILQWEVEGKLYDGFRYSKAVTGRFSGQGYQPQNFPRAVSLDEWNELKEKYQKFNEDYKQKKISLSDDGFLEAEKLYEKSSSILRGLVRAEEGKKFIIADYAQIELRMILWFVGHKEHLQKLIDGEDLYLSFAEKIFKKKLTKDSEERRIAKQAVLSLNYGTGRDKFNETAFGGENISLASKVVDVYREEFYKITNLWRSLDNIYNNIILVDAFTKKPLYGGECRIEFKLRMVEKEKCLEIKLPSQRKIIVYPSQHKHMWGGVLTNYIIQGMARDVMIEAMRKKKRRYYNDNS